MLKVLATRKRNLYQASESAPFFIGIFTSPSKDALHRSTSPSHHLLLSKLSVFHTSWVCEGWSKIQVFSWTVFEKCHVVSTSTFNLPADIF